MCSCGCGLTHGCGTDRERPAQSSLVSGVEDSHHVSHTDCGVLCGDNLIPPEASCVTSERRSTAQKKGMLGNPQIQELTSTLFLYPIVNFYF